MHISRFTGCLGAVVEDVDLRTIDEDQVGEIRTALLAHLVLFFRGQELSDTEHVALASRFGPPSVYPIQRLFGGTEATVGFIEDDADRPPAADGWHTDVTWIPDPPAIGVLYACDIPPYGGDTMWANLVAAYDSLSPPLARLADGLLAWHAPGEGFFEAVGKRTGPEIAEQIRAAFPGAEHPLVRTNAETGRRALYVSPGFLRHLQGVTPAESRALLALFVNHARDERFVCRWRWQPGDLVLWDERVTMHMALPDHYPQHRRMRRCTVDETSATPVARA